MTDVAALLKALHFAARKHRDQRRKGRSASPYINHPIAVAELLVRVGGVTDTTTLLGAVLHDTVEDTQTTFEELEAEFGREVRDVVAELTDDKRLPSQERKRLQVERAAAASARARLIKLADKICNVHDIAHDPPASWSPERRREYYEWSTAVVDRCRGTNAALEARFDQVLSRAMRALAALLLALALLALASGRVAAQTPASAPAACAQGPAPLPLSRPFVPGDTVTLLRGEIVANGANGKGSLTIEYLTRTPRADTAARLGEATALVHAITPITGVTPYAALTLRACARTAGRTAPVVVESFDFARGRDGDWALVRRP